MRIALVTIFVCLLNITQAHALNIVLTNDDGLTSNVKALYEQLKAEGHDVIVSVPCYGQSGMSGAIKFMAPIQSLGKARHNGAAEMGAPGVGPMTRPGLSDDYFYVSGTPVMALLYALDIQTMARWGKAPDLILSGPNEGQNVGTIVITSGTVSNAQYGAIRGIPSIALSAGKNTVDDGALSNPKSRIVAQLVTTLIDHLTVHEKNEALLPRGFALNVNFPDQVENPAWRFSRIGSYDAYRVRFVTDLSADPMVKTLGRSLPHQSGIALIRNQASPQSSEQDNESVLNATYITITVMQIGYDAKTDATSGVRQRLGALLAD